MILPVVGLTQCVCITANSHTPRQKRLLEPSHSPSSVQVLVSLPINLNPALHSYLAMLLNVVLPLTRVKVPLRRVGGPQSTTADEEGVSILSSHHCVVIEQFKESSCMTHFDKLAWFRSTVY